MDVAAGGRAAHTQASQAIAVLVKANQILKTEGEAAVRLIENGATAAKHANVDPAKGVNVDVHA